MSDQPMAGFPGEGQQPSEEEMRAAVQQMRAAPVDQLVAEMLSALLNSAQMKLGRNDGRLLLDLAAVMNDGTRSLVDPELTGQVDEALAQLRIAQVQAEGEIAQAVAEQGHVEHGDLPSKPAQLRLAGAGEAGAPAAEPTPPPATSRLWTPGP